MKLPLPEKETERKRLTEWGLWLTNFASSQSEIVPKPEFKIIENAAWILNDTYWRIVYLYLKPLLKVNEDEIEHNIHFYKIISTSEIVIMMVRPFNTAGNEDLESSLNASFAYYVGINILSVWHTGNKTILTGSNIKKIAYCQENIEEERYYPETFAKEHIQWLANLNVTTEKPIMLNAQCWRLFYLACLAVATNGNM